MYKLIRLLALALVVLGVIVAVSFASAPITVAAPQAQTASQLTMTISRGFTASATDAAPGGEPGLHEIELRGDEDLDGANSARVRSTNPGHRTVNRSLSDDRRYAGGRGSAPTIVLPHPLVSPTAIDGSTPGMSTSFNGLRHRDQRLASSGNQFSLEPPDQALCVGGNYVVEATNDVFRVRSKAGGNLTGVVALNAFYGYLPAINRSTGKYGPFVTDPICYYDPDNQRFILIVLTLDTNYNTGGFLGTNHLDIAVSATADPTGSWYGYSLPVHNNGANGTPNHNCFGGYCIGDYPHMGADKYGIYITTNEYEFFGPNYTGAQLYAISKKALASGALSIPVYYFQSLKDAANRTSFTVWPATSPAGGYSNANNGTEFFLSSTAGDEVFCPSTCTSPGFSRDIDIWALVNTGSLDTFAPALALRTSVIPVGVYTFPPKATQKVGDFPLGQCINDTSIPTPFGTGCWRLFFGSEPPHTMVEGKLDSHDTRMQQTWYANGILWGALDTGVSVGSVRAGIEYFAIQPIVTRSAVIGLMQKQGYIGTTNNDVTYPAVGTLNNGKGVMAFTLTGNDYFPSAGYVTLSTAGHSNVHVAAAGTATQDGFSEYPVFSSRSRWGDYGAVAFDGDGTTMWLASEYIGQPACTLAQYVNSPSFTLNCSSTRTSLANWHTRITRVAP